MAPLSQSVAHGSLTREKKKLGRGQLRARERVLLLYAAPMTHQLANCHSLETAVSVPQGKQVVRHEPSRCHCRERRPDPRQVCCAPHRLPKRLRVSEEARNNITRRPRLSGVHGRTSRAVTEICQKHQAFAEGSELQRMLCSHAPPEVGVYQGRLSLQPSESPPAETTVFSNAMVNCCTIVPHLVMRITPVSHMCS